MSNPWYRTLPTNIIDIQNGQSGTLIPPANTLVRGLGHVYCPNLIIYLDNPDSYAMNLHLGGKHRMTADRTGFINNVMEGDGTLGYAGLLSTTGKNQLTYNNIIRNCQHGFYVQNKNTDLTEYVVQNYFGDCVPSDNSRSIHAYTQQPDNMYNLSFIQNVMANNEALLGGEVNATSPMYNLFKENWFNLASLNLGYKRAEATDLLSNRFYNSILLREHLMGDDIQSDDYSVVSDNDFYNDGAAHGWDHVRFATHNPDARIRSLESWNNNRFYGPDYMRAPFHAGGVSTYCRGLSEWRAATGNAGNTFDANSVFNIGPPPNNYWLIPNDYDANRATLVVWNGNHGTVSVTTPRMATIAPVTSPYVESSQNTRFVISADSLSYWVVRYKVFSNGCDLDEARRLLNEAHGLSTQKKVKTRITLALEAMEGC